MASGVHAHALRVKQKKKQQLLLAAGGQHQQLSLPGCSSLERRSFPGWDGGGSDVSGEGKTYSAEHRLRAERAYQKWLKKQKEADRMDHKTSYIVAKRAAEEAGGGFSACDLLLWLGMAVLVSGLIVSFVGLGEKGFRTNYLRLLGPALCTTGLSAIVIRIFFCCCCCRPRPKKKKPVFGIGHMLARAVLAQEAAAAQTLQSAIPTIHIDQGYYKTPSSTHLSAYESDEAESLIHQTTAVIESERTGPVTLQPNQMHQSISEPGSLTATVGSCSPLLSRSWSDQQLVVQHN